jgi:hypothetical protein
VERGQDTVKFLLALHHSGSRSFQQRRPKMSESSTSSPLSHFLPTALLHLSNLSRILSQHVDSTAMCIARFVHGRFIMACPLYAKTRARFRANGLSARACRIAPEPKRLCTQMIWLSHVMQNVSQTIWLSQLTSR